MSTQPDSAFNLASIHILIAKRESNIKRESKI